MLEPILIAFLGYVVGALFRTLYDFLWKTVDNPDFKWTHKYTVTMLVSVILSVMSATVTFTTIQVPVNGSPYILLSSITLGFTVNHLMNKPIDYLSKKKA